MAAAVPQSSFGSTSIAELSKETLNTPSFNGDRVAAYRWLPGPSLSYEVAKHYPLGMWHVVEPDGIRRFFPIGSFDDFVINAAAAGSEILFQTRQLNAEQRHTYRLMRIIHQMAPRIQEFYRRDFRKEQDLYVARVGGTEGTVLPSDLGLHSSADENGWNASDLMNEGRNQAAKLGMTKKKDPARLIRLGLLEAAKRNPIPTEGLQPTQALTIVQTALFDVSDLPASIDTATRDLVDDRFLGAIENHLNDDSDTFNSWMFDKISNIVHLISKARSGGNLSRNTVRQAIFSRILDAYQYVGPCVSLWTQEFVRSFPTGHALTEAERARFSFRFDMQPWLGGLPLVLLHPRYDFLNEFFREFDETPNDPGWPGILLRLLACFGEMATRRRSDDRDHKKRGAHRNHKGRRATMSSSSIEEIEEVAENEDFREIARILRERHGVLCSCQCKADWVAFLDEFDSGRIRVKYECRRCHRIKSLTIFEEEFRSAGDWLRDDAET